MTAQCPRCAIALAATELQQVPVARCPRCRGLWFEAHALRAAREAADPDLAFLEVELWSDAEQFRHARAAAAARPATAPCTRSNTATPG